MTRTTPSQALLTICLTGAVGVGLSDLAYAYWTSQGEGSGTALTSTVNPATGLQATSSSPDSVTLTWSAPTGGTAPQAYRVLRDGAVVATLESTVLTYVDAARTASTTYSYSITSVLGSWTASTDLVSVTTPAPADATAPAVTITDPVTPSNDSAPLLSGSYGIAEGDEAAVLVQVYSGAAAVGSPIRATLDSTAGTWTAQVPALLDGTYTARATQTDAGNNVGTATSSAFTVDSDAPSVTISTPASPSGTTTPTFSGAYGSAVGDSAEVHLQLYDGTTPIGSPISATLNTAEHTWSAQVPADSALGDGSYTAQATQGDTAGNSGTAASGLFTVDTTAPALTITNPPTPSNSNAPMLSGSYGTTSGDRPAVSVQVYSGSTPVGAPLSATLDATAGTWSAQVPALADGSYAARATQSDAAGNVTSASTSSFIIDTVAPALTGLQMLDDDKDGKVDQVTATFDETLATSADKTPWSLANVPSAGVLGSVSTSGSTVTLTIVEGAGAHDTSVGSFTVGLSAAATGVRDAAGNQSSFAATAPGDKAGPVSIAAASTNGNGIFGSGDVLSITYSEALSGFVAGPTVTVSQIRANNNSPGNVVVTVPGLFSNLTSVHNSYQSRDTGVSATGTRAYNATTKSVTMTLSAVTGSGATAGTESVTVTPVTTGLQDAAGNVAVVKTVTFSRLW